MISRLRGVGINRFAGEFGGVCANTQKAPKRKTVSGPLNDGRSERIRTSDPCLPKTVLYQAELRSVILRSRVIIPNTDRRKDFLRQSAGTPACDTGMRYQYGREMQNSTASIIASLIGPSSKRVRVSMASWPNSRARSIDALSASYLRISSCARSRSPSWKS